MCLPERAGISWVSDRVQVPDMRVLWRLMSRSLPQILQRLMDRVCAEDVQDRLLEFLEDEVSHSD